MLFRDKYITYSKCRKKCTESVQKEVYRINKFRIIVNSMGKRMEDMIREGLQGASNIYWFFFLRLDVRYMEGSLYYSL